MWKAAKQMLGSKKALAAVLSVVVWVVGRFGADLDVNELLPVVGPLWLFIFSQGIADHGKEAEKVAVAAEAEKAAADLGPVPDWTGPQDTDISGAA